jgi:hypothetical protein
MKKRNRIEYLRKRIRRDETLQIGLPFDEQNEIVKSLSDWSCKFHTSDSQTIKLYDSDYDNIEWHIIKPTREFRDFASNSSGIQSVKNSIESYRVRIPNQFIELDIEFSTNGSNSIEWNDLDSDIELLKLDHRKHHKYHNVSYKAKELVVREQIIQLLEEIWVAYNLEPKSITINHKRVHFVDSTPGIVQKAVLTIMSKIIGVEPNNIKQAIEDKFKLMDLYFETMNYNFIDIYERLASIKPSGGKLISSNEYRAPSSRLVERVNINDTKGINIKNALLIKGDKESVMMTAPKFNDALVFRDDKENIEGIFHCCFETNVIQNEKRIFMNTNNVQMKKLKLAIRSSR